MIGESLGPYRLVESLRAGGMGMVYRALDTRLQRTVAIKILKASQFQHPERGLRFEQEARAASALNHPNIVMVYDVSEFQGQPFIVMEFVDGDPLDRILSHGSIHWRTALSYARQLADALACAHRARIVHRDLKPANIIITLEGRVKVLDFGLAKFLEPESLDTDQITLTAATPPGLRTEAGQILGTPAYMSPEQVNGLAAGPASDIFSFGVLLWEMLSGRQAFTGVSNVAIMAQVLTAQPETLAGIVDDIPPALAALVESCLSKVPGQRKQSMQEVKEAMDAIIGDVAPSVTSHSSDGGAAVRSPTPHPAPSIAILPFVNALQDRENDYFADGLSEEITFRLGQSPGVRVMARASAGALRKEGDMLRSAARLGINYVLDGSIRRQGSRMRVFAQLVRTADGMQLWTERYDRDVSDVFAVQDEIAGAIARLLALRLDTSASSAPVARHRPDSITTYQLYLKGRHFWNRRTWQSLRKGIELFQEAVNADSLYTLAYVGLADSYNLLGYYAERPPRAAYPKAKAAALKALDLDDGVAEAHASLGYTKLFFDWDWEGADVEFQRAITLDPNYSSAHQWRAWYFFAMNRLSDALAALAKAQELDPLSVIISDHLALALVLNGQAKAALNQIRQNLEMDSTFPLSYRRLGLFYYNSGQLDEAQAAMEKAVDLSAGAVALGPLGFIYGRRGELQKAEEVIARLHRMAQERYVSPLELALVYGGMGDLDNTFEEFGRAFR